MRFRVVTIDPDTAVEQRDVHTLDVKREGSGLRIVFDEDGSGEEFDTLVEHWPGRSGLLLHAWGADPVLVIEILPDRLEVRDAAGQALLTVPVPQRATRST